MVFAHGHHQRVKFVQELQAKLRRVVGKCGIHELLHMGIFTVAAGETVALGDAAQVLIDDRDGMEQRVEQNGVGGLLSHPRQRQQLVANHAGRLRR